MTSRTPAPAPPAGTTPALGTRRLERCPSCGSPQWRLLPLRYEFRGATFPLVECRSCELRFLAVQPDRAGLTELYSPEYFERDYRCGRVESSSFGEEAFRDENRGLLERFARLTAPGRLLEIGCATGWLLKHARERGWEVQGVELSADAVAHARGLGLEVFQGEVLDAHLPADRFDLVYLGDVLEHVPDAHAVLAEVARVLRPGGHLVLRGPITTHSLARSLGLAAYGALGRTIVLREPPYHLWEFTPRSLVHLCERVGLAVVSLEQSKIPPGRAHGEKSAIQRSVMAVIDAINVPLTRMWNARGDRVMLVARKPTLPDTTSH